MLCEVYKTVNYPGGIEKVLCSFANEFVKREYDVSYVCLDKEKGMPFYPLDAKVKFINLCYLGRTYGGFGLFWAKLCKEFLRTFCGSEMRFLGKKVYDPKKAYFETEFIKRLIIAIEEQKPDLIICADSQALYIAQSACENKIPTIAQCHTDPVTLAADLPMHELEAWKKAKKVQVLANAFKKFFVDLGIDRITVIPNVVQQVEDNNLVDLDNCHKNIIFMGRLERVAKRPHLLLEAFSKIAAKYEDWNIKIYGRQDNKRYVEDMQKFIAAHKMQNQVQFCGLTNDASSKFRESDICVSTSAFEGFGLSVAEAMGTGLPCIAFEECSSLNELIVHGETGLLVKDVDDLATKLELLINDKGLRKKLGLAAHKRMEHFAPEKIWDIWEKLINEAVDGK